MRRLGAVGTASTDGASAGAITLTTSASLTSSQTASAEVSTSGGSGDSSQTTSGGSGATSGATTPTSRGMGGAAGAPSSDDPNSGPDTMGWLGCSLGENVAPDDLASEARALLRQAAPQADIPAARARAFAEAMLAESDVRRWALAVLHGEPCAARVVVELANARLQRDTIHMKPRTRRRPRRCWKARR